MAANESNMTTAQLGRRLDRVENDVGELKTEVVKSTASIDAMRGDIAVMFQKLDSWGSAISDSTATKGMIPTQYIWASLALFVSLVGVGLTALKLSRDDTNAEMNQRAIIASNEAILAQHKSKSADELSTAKREAAVQLLEEKISHLETRTTLEAQSTVERLEDALDLLEQQKKAILDLQSEVGSSRSRGSSFPIP